MFWQNIEERFINVQNLSAISNNIAKDCFTSRVGSRQESSAPHQARQFCFASMQEKMFCFKSRVGGRQESFD